MADTCNGSAARISINVIQHPNRDQETYLMRGGRREEGSRYVRWFNSLNSVIACRASGKSTREKKKGCSETRSTHRREVDGN